MDNKSVIQAVIDAFDNNSPEDLYPLITDDFQWDMKGDQLISGKENLRKMFSMGKDIQMVSSTKDHIIIDGDTAAVDGKVDMKHPDGRIEHMNYCDIYELEGGKVKKMVTYMTKPK
jgi:uncharacterized protein